MYNQTVCLLSFGIEVVANLLESQLSV